MLPRDNRERRLADFISEGERVRAHQVGHVKQRDVFAREVGERVVLVLATKGLQVHCLGDKPVVTLANAKASSVQRDIRIVCHAVAGGENPLLGDHAAHARGLPIDIDVDEGRCLAR